MNESNKRNNSHCHIIHNSIGSFFESNSYEYTGKKNYDFITIRSDLDGSKYCIDLVINFAKKYPEKKFLIIGKGKFFEYNTKPDNVEWINSTLSHEEMKEYVDRSLCALLPTREDTQGVMACEMATYGIPTITSDIEICHEILDKEHNVEFMDNNPETVNLIELRNRLMRNFPYHKSDSYFARNTIANEIEVYLNRF